MGDGLCQGPLWWGARRARGTSRKSANLPHRVYMLKTGSKIVRNSPNMGTIPRRYLDNQRSNRHGMNTDVPRNERAGECNAGWQAARGTCDAYDTFDRNLAIFNVFHDWHWYSATICSEEMKRTSFGRKMYRLSDTSINKYSIKRLVL